MPKKVLLLVIPFLFLLFYPSSVSADTIPYCCETNNPPLTYEYGFCVNQNVINICNGITNLACNQLGAILGNLVCGLTPAPQLIYGPCVSTIGTLVLATGSLDPNDFCTTLLTPYFPKDSLLLSPAITVCTTFLSILPEIVVKPPRVNTGLGCLSIELVTTIQTTFNWAIGLTGAIAFFVILIAALRILTAQGDPKAVKAGQELLTSALFGLVLIVLSVILLNVIGIKILNLGSLGFSP